MSNPCPPQKYFNYLLLWLLLNYFFFLAVNTLLFHNISLCVMWVLATFRSNGSWGPKQLETIGETLNCVVCILGHKIKTKTRDQLVKRIIMVKKSTLGRHEMHHLFLSVFIFKIRVLALL